MDFHTHWKSLVAIYSTSWKKFLHKLESTIHTRGLVTTSCMVTNSVLNSVVSRLYIFMSDFIWHAQYGPKHTETCCLGRACVVELPTKSFNNIMSFLLNYKWVWMSTWSCMSKGWRSVITLIRCDISPAHSDSEHSAPPWECSSSDPQYRLPAAPESSAAVAHPLSSSLSGTGNTALITPSIELVLQKEH